MSSRKREICQDTSWSRRFQFVRTLCNVWMSASEGEVKRETIWDTLGWVNVVFNFIYSNILAPLKYEADYFKQSMWLCLCWCRVFRMVSDLEYLHNLLVRRQSRCTYTPKQKSDYLEQIELHNYVVMGCVVQRWVTTPESARHIILKEVQSPQCSGTGDRERMVKGEQTYADFVGQLI